MLAKRDVSEGCDTMTSEHRDRILRFYSAHHPFASLEETERSRLVNRVEAVEVARGAQIYNVNDTVQGLYAIGEGSVEIYTGDGFLVSQLHVGECFGERGILMDGTAPYEAKAADRCLLFLLPAKEFLALLETRPAFAIFFGRHSAGARTVEGGRTVEPDSPTPSGPTRIDALMTPNPVSLPPDAAVSEAAAVMQEKRISCLTITQDDRLQGIVTASDLCGRVLAKGLGGDTPLSAVMTRDPISLAPDAVSLDAMAAMLEHHVGHLPIVQRNTLVGIVTRTDLLLQSALSLPMLVGEIGRRAAPADLAETTAKIPDLLAQLVGAGLEHHVVTRMITDVSDALTRRLLVLAEEALGPSPGRYLWAACGSQGRQEQTGVTDQDNCLILADDCPRDDAYFAALAKFVSDGLDACGFVHCPGDMMATNPKWRQPLATWRAYFARWIDHPDPTARMLASVMFDLRPISGDATLLAGLQEETLARAGRNSIFLAHMVANSLTHQPPLGLFRGFALSRSGEHKGTLDLKLSGVVPIVDLARLYALKGGIAPVNTRARLVAAQETGVVSPSGGRDLLDAYDLIAEMRLRHQADQIRRGAKPDNFMIPASLSDLERSHLRSAFVVVKTMQSAAAQGRQTVV